MHGTSKRFSCGRFVSPRALTILGFLLGACGSDTFREQDGGSPGEQDASEAAANGGAGGSLDSALGGAGGMSGDATPTTASPPIPSLVCQLDDDCCAVLDWCEATMWLTNRADEPAVIEYLASLHRTVCYACVPPKVQVSCRNGQCVGTAAGIGDGGVGTGSDTHCGVVQGLDVAGISSVDAGTSVSDASTSDRGSYGLTEGSGGKAATLGCSTPKGTTVP